MHIFWTCSTPHSEGKKAREGYGPTLEGKIQITEKELELLTSQNVRAARDVLRDSLGVCGDDASPCGQLQDHF